MYCEKCGATLPVSSKFCTMCGTTVTPAYTAPVEKPIPTPLSNIPAAYQQPAAYQPPAAYQSPATYQPPAAYQSPATYQPPAAYQSPLSITPPEAQEDAGSSKGKRKIWIPIAAGIAVLALTFGALSLFTEIFPPGRKSGEAQTEASSQSRDDNNQAAASIAPSVSPSVTPTLQEVSPSQGSPSTLEHIPEPNEPDSMKARALAYLDELDCPVMEDNENRVGIRIRSIEKVDDGYKICWDSDMGDSNAAYMFSLMRFFDPDDYSNNYQPFTISDGSLTYTFGEGDWISYKEFRVRDFEPDCMMFYLYFEGALESMGAPPDIQTDPLFFTFVLGDEPELVEESPRFANGIFADSAASDDKPEAPSSIPAEYIGQWIGFSDGAYLEFAIEADGSGVYTYTDGRYSENYDITLEIGTETFAVHVPSNNTSGIVAIDGTYEYLEGMLILNITTTVNSGKLPSSTVPCVRVSDNVAGGADYVSGYDYEIRTAVYDMVVLYMGQWKDGKPNGGGIAIVLENIPGRFERGDTLAGFWVDGLLQGPGVYTSYDGVYSLRGTFINGLKEGTVKAYQNGSYLNDIEFVNGSPA